MVDTLNALVGQVLGVKPEVVTDDLSMDCCAAWDSLKHMEIIVALEQTLGVELTFDEIVEMRSVAAIRRVLAARGKA